MRSSMCMPGNRSQGRGPDLWELTERVVPLRAGASAKPVHARRGNAESSQCRIHMLSRQQQAACTVGGSWLSVLNSQWSTLLYSCRWRECERVSGGCT